MLVFRIVNDLIMFSVALQAICTLVMLVFRIVNDMIMFSVAWISVICTLTMLVFYKLL
jgi:hypothetical protein